jgi:serine/threonine protein kinase
MGVVYRARDPLINRLVALKTITASGADYQSLLQRFYREAQSAGGLQHPNIVTIYELGDEGGVAFIAMELIEGQNLEEMISRRQAVPLPLKLVYAIQACSALDYAHKRGIVHRDIKPGNMMVNKEGTVKVVDFGIARVLETSKTQTGMLIGTFAYMSPEQYHGEHADERSDLWSFGVLLYELLCYQRPFVGDTPASLMLNICQNEPRPLRELAAECPPELQTLVERLLRKLPAERYQSMEELLADLDPIRKTLQQESVAAMVKQSRQLADSGDFPHARDLLKQALQIDSTNFQVRNMLEKLTTELRPASKPGTAEILKPDEHADAEKKKQQTRQEVEHRIREIKVKINREKFSEAIELAKRTLATMGPDSGVTQLLTSAEFERDARERKRQQEIRLSAIRALLEAGNPSGAGRTLEEAIATKVFDPLDSRIQQVAREIEAAKTLPTPRGIPRPRSVPADPTKEYAFLQPAPSPPGSSVPDTPGGHQSATQAVSQTQPGMTQAARPLPTGMSDSGVQASHQPLRSSSQTGIPPLAPTVYEPSGTTPQAWKKPALLIVVALALVGLAGAGYKLWLKKPSKTLVSPVVTSAPGKPTVDPLEVRQRAAMEDAGKLVAANDLPGAVRILRDAANLNGPLTSDVQKKEEEIQESLKDKDLAQLRQREEQLWERAMGAMTSRRYKESQNDLHQILNLPTGGVRRADAQKYLDTTIPQHEAQDGLAAQARQALKQNNFASARQIVDQFQKNGGDPMQLQKEMDQKEQDRLNAWADQFKQLSQRDDDAAIQQLRLLQTQFQDLASNIEPGPRADLARSYSDQIPAAISSIQSRQANKSADASFQQAIQKYQQAASSSDRAGLEAARGSFQSVAQAGGAHAADARQYVNEINGKLSALNSAALPVAPSVAPSATKPETPPASPGDPAPAIRSVIQRYALAFDQRDADGLRQIWPSMGKRYAGYKNSFGSAASIHMEISISTIDVAADGATATVTSTAVQQYTPKGGKTASLKDTWVFQLALKNGAWLITDVQ